MVTTEVLQFSLALFFLALVLVASYWFVLLAQGPSDRVEHARDEEPAGEKKSEREGIEEGVRRR